MRAHDHTEFGTGFKPECWLDASSIAALIGRTDRHARRIMALRAAAGEWDVRRERCAKGGGKAGERPVVLLPSIDPELQLTHHEISGMPRRFAGRRVVVDQLERLAAAHGERRAVRMVLDRANHGDLRDALFWAGFEPGQELRRAALTRWRREFDELAAALLDEDLAALAREARARPLRKRMQAERKPAAPSIHHHKITIDDLRQAARATRAALPEPNPMPRRIRRVA